jgi:hypothetical protein
MTDPLLDRFSDLNWPGKRKPVNRTDVPERPEPAVWDEKPLKYMYKGVEREFFTISHLSTALGKAPVTIRSWENKGILPSSSYRSPRPRGGNLPGTTPKGKRLWTKDQILGIIQIAQEEKVIFNGKTPTKRFAERVNTLYIKLRESDEQ